MQHYESHSCKEETAAVWIQTWRWSSTANKQYSLLWSWIVIRSQWNTHVRKTASKANQTLGVLRRNLKNFPREIKNMAYKSIPRPKMEYAAPIWDPYTKDNIQLLEAVQRRAARFVCNKYSRHESVTSMLQDLDWPLLEQRRAESRLTLFHRIVHKEVDINH